MSSRGLIHPFGSCVAVEEESEKPPGDSLSGHIGFKRSFGFCESHQVFWSEITTCDGLRVSLELR